jgi:hypothetical protein
VSWKFSISMFTGRSSVKTFSSFGLHQRTASLKLQGIPLIPYEASPSNFDLFSVSENANENEPEFDDPGGTLDDPNTFQITDMNAQDQASTTLPPPALQRSSSPSSARKDSRDGEYDGTTIARLKKHLYAEVDGDQSTAPLSAYCFMTGFMCVDYTLCSFRASSLYSTATLSHFLLYLYGAHSRRETVYKYEYFCDHRCSCELIRECSYLACPRPRPPIQRAARPLFPYRRPTGTLLIDHIHIRRLHRAPWG